MKKLLPNQRKLIEHVIPFYNPKSKKDQKLIERFHRVLKDGKYTDEDSTSLNGIRKAYEYGIFENGISEKEKLNRIHEMIFNKHNDARRKN